MKGLSKNSHLGWEAEQSPFFLESDHLSHLLLSSSNMEDETQMCGSPSWLNSVTILSAFPGIYTPPHLCKMLHFQGPIESDSKERNGSIGMSCVTSVPEGSCCGVGRHGLCLLLPHSLEA